MAYRLMSEDQAIFLPGKTSHGHYQIELDCGACHTDSFGGGQVLQEACMSCHGKELKNVDDSHPKSKFTDPRNADRVANLDARKCVACHVEHKPEITSTMAVTVPEDVCVYCHMDIAEDRPSHAGMAFDTCASAGCHNFHDNQGLYEDFLLKHTDEADVKAEIKVKNRNYRESIHLISNYPLEAYPLSSLSLAEKDVPSKVKVDQKVLQEWNVTSHAKAGVNCTACHSEFDKPAQTKKWINNPDHSVCISCHEAETEGFLSGKHGMRLKQNMSAMTPAMARLPMKPFSHDKELNCTSCHSSHKFDTRHAAVEACLSCHNDEHSLAYKSSKHYALWYKETNAQAETGSGVSCTTCHMPRTLYNSGDGNRVIVQHNQNDNLRPNEKMLRTVCMDCHGLGFSIDALADEGLIKNNFKGRPKQHIKSIDMAKDRIKNKELRQVGEGDK